MATSSAPEAPPTLDLQLPQFDGGCCETCLTEMCSIYRIGILRLGVVQILCGVFCLCLSGVLMWLTSNNLWATLSVAAASLYFICGLICVGNRKAKPRGKISLSTSLCLLAVASATFLTALSAYSIDVLLDDRKRLYPHYRYQQESPLMIINAFLLVFSLVEFVAATWCACLTLGMVCLCCYLPGRGRVFTIPYEDMGDLEGEARGPDILTQITSRPVLQITWVDMDDEEEMEGEVDNRFLPSPDANLRTNPAVYDASLRTDPTVYDASLRTNPAVYDASLRTNPAVYDASLRTNPAVYDASLRTNPAVYDASHSAMSNKQWNVVV